MRVYDRGAVTAAGLARALNDRAFKGHAATVGLPRSDVTLPLDVLCWLSNRDLLVPQRARSPLPLRPSGNTLRELWNSLTSLFSHRPE
jgi:hypothetical protein